MDEIISKMYEKWFCQDKENSPTKKYNCKYMRIRQKCIYVEIILGVLKKDPTVWPDGARSPPKYICKYRKIKQNWS